MIWRNIFPVRINFRNFQSVCESLNSFVSRKIVKFSYWLIVWNRISRLITKFVVTTQCGNYRNSLSHIFGKKFVKVTVLLNELLKSWFDEIFLVRENFSFFHTVHTHAVEFTKFLYHGFFRENNFFSKEFSVKLISRNDSQVIQKFHKLHTVHTQLSIEKWKIWFHQKNISSNQLFAGNSASKNVTFTKFLSKKWDRISRFSTVHHCANYGNLLLTDVVFFSWNQLFSNLFSENVTFTKFL